MHTLYITELKYYFILLLHSLDRPNALLLANLVSIKKIDISHNNLSRKISEFFASLSTLQDLNLSFNNFDGAVLRGGVFANVFF
jgi:hypothetical protein